MLSACRPLKPVSIESQQSLEGYRYFFVTPTNTITSDQGNLYGREYGTYGSSSSKTFNPSDAIAGLLIKEGFMRIPALKPEIEKQTFIINYGESNRHSRGWGYTIEVATQFISASNREKICGLIAKGQGETEVDDVKKAINRCMEASIPKQEQ
jgi:hypothetical protein